MLVPKKLNTNLALEIKSLLLTKSAAMLEMLYQILFSQIPTKFYLILSQISLFLEKDSI